MDLTGASALVTGGASGLGLATARALVERGVQVVILDLPSSAGLQVADTLGAGAHFSAGDVTDSATVEAALDLAAGLGPIRALVHCAGRGASMRVLDRDGNPGSLETFRSVVDVNLVGTFNVLRLTAARMSAQEPRGEERGVCVLTASVAAWEGQIGQMPYAASKAGVVGMTIVAARDLAKRGIRVCTIAPGVFDTPILGGHPPEAWAGLLEQVPHPSRLGHPEEFASLAMQIIDNAMLNGETIRLDGALRMGAR